jgi:hypothetical protein
LKAVEELFAHGHQNVLGTHSMTFEITKASHLTRRGDCVIAVNATKAPVDFSSEFKDLCRREKTQITITLEAADMIDIIRGSGSSDLRFADHNEMVGRKSSFVSDRTILIRADKAARDLKRGLIKALMSPQTKLTIRLTAQA